MPKERPDFIQVRLSPHALATFGADAQFRISNAHSHYVFAGSAPTEILRTEWTTFYSKEKLDGQPLLEAAPSEIDSTQQTEA